jgi:hypothetical protein
MKAKICSLFVLVVIASHLFAQTPAAPPAQQTSPAPKPPANMAVAHSMSASSVGSVISQLANNLQPSAFTDDWGKAKESWMKSVSALKPMDVAGGASAISTLVNNLKPATLTSEFSKSKEDFMVNVKNAKTVSDIASLLKSLSAGINPSAFTADWSKNKATWMQNVNSLASMK